MRGGSLIYIAVADREPYSGSRVGWMFPTALPILYDHWQNQRSTRSLFPHIHNQTPTRSPYRSRSLLREGFSTHCADS